MEAILFIGLQGAGKTTLYRQRFFDTHLRLSLDMLRTRHRERLLFEACLKAKAKFVVDNTNPTREVRSRFIIPARQARFEVVGYYFPPDMNGCLHRNQARQGKALVPDAAIRRTFRELEPPGLDEGFDKLFTVEVLEESLCVTPWTPCP